MIECFDLCPPVSRVPKHEINGERNEDGDEKTRRYEM
jgi:hypothetical protein